MNIQKRKANKRRSLLWVLVIIVCIIAATALWFFVLREHKGETSSSINKSDSQRENDMTDAQNKQSLLDSDAANKGSDDTSTTTSPTPQISSDDISLTTNETDSLLVITTSIKNFSGTGTCSLALTKPGSDPITQSANVLYQEEYSTCEGFSIEKSKLDKGSWTIKLSVNSSQNTYEKLTTHIIK